MMMKTKLMVMVVIAGLITAGYRFLPSDLRHELDARLDKIVKPEVAETNATENKKYVVHPPKAESTRNQSAKTPVASAYIQRLEDVQVHDEGRVVAVLSDDRKGSKHQRFIVRTNEDISVLIAHNIDLAKRVNNINQGDTVEFSGEYVWNEKGGVVHWTHRDPDGRHTSGWLKHNGTTYQ
jgi:hypothetical protein